jgi:hypothetical protein
MQGVVTTSDPVPLPQNSTQENKPVGNLESQGDNPTKVCPIPKRKKPRLNLLKRKSNFLRETLLRAPNKLPSLIVPID